MSPVAGVCNAGESSEVILWQQDSEKQMNLKSRGEWDEASFSQGYDECLWDKEHIFASTTGSSHAHRQSSQPRAGP